MLAYGISASLAAQVQCYEELNWTTKMCICIYTHWNTNSSSTGNGKELEPLKSVVITINQALASKEYKPTVHVLPNTGWETGDEHSECMKSLKLRNP